MKLNLSLNKNDNMVGSEITVKKIVCIVLSIMTAFMLFSAAYGLWEKKLTIKGNFKVVKMEPDFETGIVQRLLNKPLLMEGIVQPAAIETPENRPIWMLLEIKLQQESRDSK